jgi:hypothetical protein
MTLGDGPALIEPLECEHATTVDAPMASDALISVDAASDRAHERRERWRDGCANSMVKSSDGAEWVVRNPMER